MKKSIAALFFSMFATPPAIAAGDVFFTGAYVGQDTYSLNSADTDYSMTAGYPVMTHATAEFQHDNIGAAAESQIDDYGSAVGFLPLNDPWSLVPARNSADTGVGKAAYQFPNRWAGKSRGSSAFSLKIPHRHLQAAL